MPARSARAACSTLYLNHRSFYDSLLVIDFLEAGYRSLTVVVAPNSPAPTLKNNRVGASPLSIRGDVTFVPFPVIGDVLMTGIRRSFGGVSVFMMISC